MGPEIKSLHALINDVDDGGIGATHVDVTPFKLKALNSTAPLENWNLTALSKVTAGTVILLEPSVKAIGFPKKELPFAVVLYTRTFAPPAGNEITFIVYVWEAWLAAPALIVVASST